MANENKIIPRLSQRQEAEVWAQVSVDDPDVCWLWNGPTFADVGKLGGFRGQYGWTPWGINAHRLIWYLSNDYQQPGKLNVLHTCDNPICCNPRHLYLGTALDNAADIDKRCRRNGHPVFRRLTDEQKDYIRLSKKTTCQLARETGFSWSTIRKYRAQ